MEVYLFNFTDYQDLIPFEIGDQVCDPMYSFGPYVRNEYILHYIVSGRGYVKANFSGKENKEDLGDWIELREGEGFVIPPNIRHMYMADREHPWHYIWIVFSGLNVPSYLRNSGMTNQNPFFRPADHLTDTKRAILAPLQAILNNPTGSGAFIIGQLHLFFDQLMQHSSITGKELPADIGIANLYVQEAIRYIEHNYSTIRSIEEIARFCTITHSHLSRLFKVKLNMTLQDYLIDYRLSKAKDLLINTNKPIYEIAKIVGYEGALPFNKAFRKRVGMPPREWRTNKRLHVEIAVFANDHPADPRIEKQL